jgi:hypothetical protein
MCLALGLLVSGCVGTSRLTGLPPAAAPVATAAPAKPGADPTREEVVAEMRAEAEQKGEAPYPDVFQTERSARLALRPEPRGVPEAQAVMAELALIAKKREAATSEREIAALEARARELQRLVDAAGDPPLRR